jgi:hypothetical protein
MFYTLRVLKFKIIIVRASLYKEIKMFLLFDYIFYKIGIYLTNSNLYDVNCRTSIILVYTM